jgi:ATP-dependent Lon protease
MENDKKDIIKAICYEFTRTNGDDSKTNYHADSVRGKGSGRIFLLHGEPGVGKTLTAECVAEATRRPLLSITYVLLNILLSKTDACLEPVT